jgi:hypothetical protein
LRSRGLSGLARSFNSHWWYGILAVVYALTECSPSSTTRRPFVYLRCMGVFLQVILLFNWKRCQVHRGIIVGFGGAVGATLLPGRVQEHCLSDLSRSAALAPRLPISLLWAWTS